MGELHSDFGGPTVIDHGYFRPDCRDGGEGERQVVGVAPRTKATD